MAKPQGKGRVQPAPATQRAVVVHVKLSAQERNALKAVLSLEGSTMQEYFAAKAAERIRGTTARSPTPPSTPASAPLGAPTLAPGQTYQMPTGRYIHWCVVCGNLWRSHEAQPEYCGQRDCHSPHWRTGTPAGETRQRRRRPRRQHSASGQDERLLKAETELVIGSEDQLPRDDDIR
jgi:hypothetical protein